MNMSSCCFGYGSLGDFFMFLKQIFCVVIKLKDVLLADTVNRKEKNISTQL